MINPDLGDYGTYGTSRHPDLWDGCIFSSTPALGVTGNVLPDFSRSGLDLGTTTPVWDTTQGIMGIKSGSYSTNNLVISPYPVITIGMSLYSKATDSLAMYLETSVNLNSNPGAIYICIQSDYLTFCYRPQDGGYHLDGIPLSTVGIRSIDQIVNLCCVWKAKVDLGECAISLLIINGVDYTSGIGFRMVPSSNLATNGFIDFPLFIGARNKTIIPMSGPCFDVAIYNRAFSVEDAFRYTQNPLERYQRRRRFWPVSRRFNPAIARNSNILIPGIATC